ncbi:CHAT domain-containing protein [Thermoleptolyngbya sp. C42_A2020_037]|uniref:CHAT domain-containing protein n=1 Tax=Thermoleptolyngbya sp. C42_A2020_037 TaxID=2747799 RepID=UPI0019E38ED4|nr:CHAT domain-containing protein [Thermoleptolyngbya sp. C42_A2020_037]MBF2083070.1 CHAT domain-containing protein [Thermoleptolyngbya sp. C42_A2020_037]
MSFRKSYWLGAAIALGVVAPGIVPALRPAVAQSRPVSPAALAQSAADRKAEADRLLQQGIQQAQSGQFRAALQSWEQALAIYREIDDRGGEGRALGNLGIAYLSLGDYRRAIEFYEQALEIAREIGDRGGEGRSLGNLGNAYLSLGDYRRAIEFYEQDLAIAREIGDRGGEGRSLGNLGIAYLSLGDYRRAIEFYEQALAIFSTGGNRAEEGIALSNIGRLLNAQDQPELAITFLKASVNVRESIRGDIRSLDTALQQSFTDSVAHTYRLLADLLLSQGRLLEAEQVLELLKIQEIREYTRGTVQDPSTRQVTLSPLEAEILKEYDSLIAFGQQVAACQQDPACRQSPRWETLQTQRRRLTAEFDQRVAAFAAEVRRRIASGDPIVGLDQLTSIGQDIVNARPGTVLLYPVVLEDRLWLLWVTAAGVPNSIEVQGVGKRQIDAAVLEFRQLMRDCEATSCRTEADIQKLQAVSQRLYNWLFPDLLVAELANSGTQHLVFALDQSLRYVPTAALFDGKQYLIERYTVSTVNGASLTNRDRPLSGHPADTSVLALGLSEPVPADPAVGMPGFNPLDHVPDELNRIVKAQSAGREQGIYRGRQRLNQQFTEASILEAPGHQILHIATHGKFDPASLYASFLVLGNKQPWRIADIRLERQIFADISLVVPSACETGLGQDDWASFHADGGKELPDGREVSSIAQAFINAGANTVIASLWQVNDGATSELMQEFYETLAQGTEQQPMAIAQAMQQAQLQMLRSGHDASGSSSTAPIVPLEGISVDTRFAHPYYWSAFVIIGNGL